MTLRLDALPIGAELPALCKAPLTTRQLVEYAGASLDFNAIHYDQDFARAAGFSSVIAHGMLSMAFFGEALAGWCGGDPTRVVELAARFKAVTLPGDVVTIGATVAGRDEDAGTVRLALEARTQAGTLTVEGTAVCRVGRR